MTLTSEDTIGIRRGQMDRLSHLLRIYAPWFTPEEIAAADALKRDEALSWQEIDAISAGLSAACGRVNRTLPRMS